MGVIGFVSKQWRNLVSPFLHVKKPNISKDWRNKRTYSESQNSLEYRIIYVLIKSSNKFYICWYVKSKITYSCSGLWHLIFHRSQFSQPTEKKNDSQNKVRSLAMANTLDLTVREEMRQKSSTLLTGLRGLLYQLYQLYQLHCCFCFLKTSGSTWYQ